MINLLVASLLTPFKNLITRCKINYARNIKRGKKVRYLKFIQLVSDAVTSLLLVRLNMEPSVQGSSVSSMDTQN